MSEKKKNIVFIFPACHTKVFGSNEGAGAHREQTISPPLGILYLSSVLINLGYEVDCYDFNAEDYSIEKLCRYVQNAHLVGISQLSFNRAHCAEIISEINERFPHLPVIAGGPDCILHKKPVHGAVCTVVHEAEEIIGEVVEAVLERKDMSMVRGVVFEQKDGSTGNGAPYYPTAHLDTYQFPRRELLRDNKGYSILGKRESKKITTIITSRGCPKRCTFCAHGALAYRKYRRRSAENVLAEIEHIANQGYKILGIVDDNFTADRERAEKILRGIIRKKIQLTMVVQGRVDCADLALFTLMKQAGVKAITFGLESGNQKALDFYCKETTVAMNCRAITLADKAGLYTAGLFIIGAAVETREDFWQTYRFAASLPLDVTSFWVLDYTYGSILWDQAVQEGAILPHEYNVPAGKERGTSPYSTAELESIAQSFFFRYYIRPSYWLRQVLKIIRIRERYFVNILSIGIFWLITRQLELHILAPIRKVCTLKRRNRDSEKKPVLIQT